MLNQSDLVEYCSCCFIIGKWGVKGRLWTLELDGPGFGSATFKMGNQGNFLMSQFQFLYLYNRVTTT